jgi:hypothetical protein
MSVDDFVAALADHPEQSTVRPIIDRLCHPVTVRALGRAGVGRRTVTAALQGAGLTLVDGPAEVEVLVIAEVAKPEDCRHAAEADAPVLLLLNKADLLGDAAPRRAGLIGRLTGAPVVAMSALLGAARLDDELIAALWAIATDPADMGSTDAFCAAPHAIDGETRSRLLAELDLSGIRAATSAIRSGQCVDGPAIAALLRRLSNIDEVMAGVHAVSAPLRYRRLRSAVTRLHALAARTGDQRLDALLAGDPAVLAAMSAATEVLCAAGLDADHGDPLRCAVRWQRYSRGPVNALHRSCGADMARGALRLAGRTP